jgi:hypothetical protein
MRKSRISLYVFLLFVFSGFVSFGVLVANDFPLSSASSIKGGLNWPQTWWRFSFDLGSYGVSMLWAWPLDLLYGLGASSGLSFAMLERLLGVLPFLVLGVYAIGKLLEHYKVKGWAKTAASLFYLTNTYILLVIDGGQFAIALAYAWFPLAFLLTQKSLRAKLKEKIIAGLGVTLLGFFDIRFVYMLFLLLILNFIYQIIFLNYKKWWGETFEWIKSGIVIGIVFAGLNAYWIIPSVLARTPQLPTGYGSSSQVSFLSFATLGHAMLLLAPHWYKNVFGKVISLQPAFYLIPFLVFLAPVLARKSKKIGFWLATSLIGVFLVKGSLEPWEAFYPWLFQNIPGFSMFRDPTKFFFLVAISYSVLIGITVGELRKRFKWSIKWGKRRLPVIPLIMSLYFVLLIYPVWTGKMTGTFSKPYNKEEFLVVNERIKNDGKSGRVLWLPTRAPMGYASPVHPSVEASRLVQKRPFVIGTVGTYEQFNFIREAGYMGEIFNVSGIEYIAYPFPDTRREELKEDNIEYFYDFSRQIEALPWVEEKVNGFPVNLFKVRENQDHFFIAANTFYVVGSDRIYGDMFNLDGFDLEENALIFAEEEPGMGSFVEELPFPKVILYNSGQTDFAATYIDPGFFVSPSDYLSVDPDSSGWWKKGAGDFLNWRSFLQQKYALDDQEFDYGQGYAVSEGENALTISNPKFIEGGFLLARIMRSSKSGSIEFSQCGSALAETDTYIADPEKVEITLAGNDDVPEQIFEYDKVNYRWQEVGELRKCPTLTFSTKGGINVINALAVVPRDHWQAIVEKIGSYKAIDWSKLSYEEKLSLFSVNSFPAVSYERLSPTHYKVSVSGINNPVSLVFSESYDNMWTANDKTSYSVYSLLNGFYISKDGEYDVYFTPQKYILPGLFVSGLTVITITATFIVTRKKGNEE